MYDCLIAGGGVIGLSLAYELSGHGQRVAVVDRAEFGREASWAGAGILPPANPQTAVDPLDRLRALSSELHPHWAAALAEETGIDTGYRRCGGIYLARQAGEAAALGGLAILCREQGIAMQQLDRQTLADIEPALMPLMDSSALRAAYWVPDEAQIRNPEHLRALLAACRNRGVELRAHEAVEYFHIAGSQMRGVQTERGLLVANQYCVASGAWSEALLRQLNIRTGILPVRGQMVLLKSTPGIVRRILNEGSRYIVPRDDGRVLVGSTEEEVGFDKRTTPVALAELKQLAADLVPQLASAPCERSWAGLRPGTYDGLPYLGRVPGLNNGFVAAGHFRSGLYMSTGTAVVMSRLMQGAEPGIELHPFRLGRG